MSRQWGDDEVIEMVELLVVAVESCRMADALVSAALARMAGTGAEVAELGSDAVRLGSMLAHLSCLRAR